jgi:flavin-dependent dehydrogenase
VPTRRTKRGASRGALGGEYDVLVCGASFAGLAVARELAGSGARVLVLDRYEIGERQTSACAAPTEWLRAMGVEGSIRQTFAELVIHTPHASVRMGLPWTFSTFDYPTLCGLLFEQCDAEFETATVRDVEGAERVLTDRGNLNASLIVDALGWRRVLDDGYQPPDAPLSRGLEVHPRGNGSDLEVWIERDVIRAGYGWSFPAADELRVGVGSFDPYDHVKQPTVSLAERLDLPSERYQGNWIPHRLREATANRVFFAGDSAGHCLPLTAEGIRPALYFGAALGREVRAVHDGRQTREGALIGYEAFNRRHRRQFELLLKFQKILPRFPHRLVKPVMATVAVKPIARFAFNAYLDIATPEFIGPAGSHGAAPKTETEATLAA